MRHCRGVSWTVISISQITYDVERSLPIHMRSSFVFVCGFFLTMLYGLQSLSYPARDRTLPPAVEMQSPNYWTTRDFPYALVS